MVEPAKVIQMQPAAAPVPAKAPLMAGEPKYLRENWKAILALSRNSELRFVRLKDGVANIANRHVLVRYPIDLPNGTYTINESNEMMQTFEPHWLDYPDVDLAMPRFERMAQVPVSGEAVKQFIPWLRQVEQVSGIVVLSRQGIHMLQNPQAMFPLALPNLNYEVTVEPAYLRLAMTEMLRYDSIWISREERTDAVTPIFLGLDWGHCALVMPRG